MYKVIKAVQVTRSVVEGLVCSWDGVSNTNRTEGYRININIDIAIAEK